MGKAPQQDNAFLLPANLKENVAKTTANSTDQITDLQGQLQSLQDALTSEQFKNSKLEAENKNLKENFPIKSSAVRFAKWYLVLIPLLSVVLLLLSANKGFHLKTCDGLFEWKWHLELGKYTQSALVISPIAFVATVLGFMIKGVFGQQSTKDGNITIADVMNFISNNGPK